MRLLRHPATLLALVSITLLTTSCSSVSPRDYADQTPPLDMREFFNGELEAWGLFQDRSGKVVNRFHVRMTGTWKDNIGTLDETFTYADARTQKRIWTITRHDRHRFSGTAGDVVGTAEGEAYGYALNWKYVLALDVNGTTWNVKLDDWMWLVDRNTLMNRSVMTKFGIHLGDVLLVIRRKV
jgi:hypothetical protein